jgi:hypothetical protein
MYTPAEEVDSASDTSTNLLGRGRNRGSNAKKREEGGEERKREGAREERRTLPTAEPGAGFAEVAGAGRRQTTVRFNGEGARTGMELRACTHMVTERTGERRNEKG